MFLLPPTHFDMKNYDQCTVNLFFGYIYLTEMPCNKGIPVYCYIIIFHIKMSQLREADTPSALTDDILALTIVCQVVNNI